LIIYRANKYTLNYTKFKTAVDSAPFRDKVWAQYAGIGWIGKNTMLITRQFGSWVFIGSLLTTLEFDRYSDPFDGNYCGNCTRCLDACPSGALIGPGRLDSRMCISYITVEHAGQLPSSYKENPAGWVFGCDICQDVCPWNRFAKPTRHRDFSPREGLLVPDLHVMSQMSVADYEKLTNGTPLRRAGRERLRRNALTVMGLL